MTYELAIAVDFITLFACGFFLRRHARLSHAHPASTYLLFHVIVFTFRLIALQQGATTLFTYDSRRSPWARYIDPVTEYEIVRAMLMVDLVLALMTAGWIWAARVTNNRSPSPQSARRFTPLRPTLVWIVVTIAFPMGILGIALFSRLPGREMGLDLGEWNASSYPLIVQSWTGLVLLVLIYIYGFRGTLMVPMGLYLTIMAYQGFHRFRVIIPIILMIQIYLSRTGRTWPTRKMSIGLIAAFFLFFPLKEMGKLAQRGAAFNEYVKLSETSINETLSGGGDDQVLLDEFAAALTLVDQSGRFYYGQPYAALITLPVPRQLWPEKPSPADYQRDLSRRWRPMHEAGMVFTFIGELYAQLGLTSVIGGSFLIAYLLGRAYYASALRPYYSVERFYYLLVACNLIQVYRDGLVSLFIFVAVNMSPLFVTVMMHLIAGIRLPLQSAVATGSLDTSPVRRPAFSPAKLATMIRR